MSSSHTPPSDGSRKLAETCYLHGVEELATGDPAKALTAFEEALRLDPSMFEALHGVVRTLQECGRIDEAIEAAKHLTFLEPDEALPHTNLSILYQQKGMLAEAEAESAKARLLDWAKQLRNPPDITSLS